MGLFDRDYFREEFDRKPRRKNNRIAAMSVTARIVIVNLFLWLANGLFFPDNNFLTTILQMPAWVIYEPIRWYTFLTSGFVHSPTDFSHIMLNMICLLMFGYGLAIGSGVGGVGLMRTDNIEWRLGRSEYFLFYILAIIFAGVSHGIFSAAASGLGASGGVVAVVIIYAFLYPNKTILFMFVIPIPMWVLGAFIVGMDFLGAMGKAESGIGYTAHLGGAFFAFLYYYLMFKKNRTIIGFFTGIKKFVNTKLKSKRKLKIFKSSDTDSDTNKNINKNTNKNVSEDGDFRKRLDQILDRYGNVGEAGLTDEEREFLQEASRIYRDQKKP
jgi:membrane associated rhomboid family serine protease